MVAATNTPPSRRSLARYPDAIELFDGARSFSVSFTAYRTIERNEYRPWRRDEIERDCALWVKDGCMRGAVHQAYAARFAFVGAFPDDAMNPRDREEDARACATSEEY